jgi:hypothetical protein
VGNPEPVVVGTAADYWQEMLDPIIEIVTIARMIININFSLIDFLKRVIILTI